MAFLALGSLLAALTWRENIAGEAKPAAATAAAASASDATATTTVVAVTTEATAAANSDSSDSAAVINASSSSSSSGSEVKKTDNLGDAFRVMTSDYRILLVGAVQALFEGAMYIFVLQW